MKSLLYLIGGLLGLTVVFLLIVPIFLPERTQITIAQEFNAPKNVLFNEFNSLRNQAEFNFIIAQDSTTNVTFFNPSSGVSADMQWSSKNPNVGSGDILITKSQENYVEQLVTLKGFNTYYNDQFSFKEIGENKSEVQWTRVGEKVGYLERILVYINDSKYTKEINSSFEKLNEIIGGTQYTDSKNTNKPGTFSTEYFNGSQLLLVEELVENNGKKIGYARNKDLQSIKSYLSNTEDLQDIKLGSAVTYLFGQDSISKKVTLGFGYSVNNALKDKVANFQTYPIPATNVVSYVITGNYSNLDSLRTSVRNYVKKIGKTPTNIFWIEELGSNAKADTLKLKAYQAFE